MTTPFSKYRQELFDHLAGTHSLHLLQSEIDDIDAIVAKHPDRLKLERQNKAMRARLEELLEVHDLLDDDTQHQTKATVAALAVE